MKQTRLWLTTIATLLCSLAASAHDFEVGGIYYNIASSTNLTVSVTYRGSSYGSYSNEYTGVVTLPSTVTYNGAQYSVTSIGSSAFDGCSSLTSITLPEGVTSIGVFAFYNCSSLTSITLSESVTSIGNGAFEDCSSLTAVHISSIEAWCKISFEDYDSNPLYYAHNLYLNGELVTELVIPESVTSIGNYAFDNCTALKKVIIEDGSSTLSLGYNGGYNGFSQGLFYDCPLEEVYLGRNLSYSSSYGYSPFYNKTKLTTLTIGDNVTSIPSYLFYNNTSLTSITLPESVTSIGNYAFENCTALKKVIIEDGSSTLSLGYNYYYSSGNGQGLFSDCPLEEVYLGRNLSYNSGSSYGYSPFYKKTKLVTLTISDNVTIIGENAFAVCSSLTSITIPEGVTSIGNYAFGSCTALKKVIIEDGNTTLSLGYNSYSNSIYYTGHGLFSGCPLKEVYLGRNLSYNSGSSYGYSPFYNKDALTNVTIGDEVTEISQYAFYDCDNIHSLTISSGVLSIGSKAFNTPPEKVIWLTNTPPTGYTNAEGSINYAANNQHSSLSNLKVYPYLSSMFEVDGVKYVPVSPSERTCHAIDCAYDGTATTINVGETASFKGVAMKITEVMPYTFYGNNHIKEVAVSHLGHIGDYAFYNCDSIKIVNVSNQGNIGSQVFYNSDAIESVTISNHGDIGEKAFYDCNGIKIIDVQNRGFVGAQAFYGCNAMETAIVTNCIPTPSSIDATPLAFADWTSTNHNPRSTSSKTYTFTAGEGATLSFNWSVSSKPVYDKLIATLDGITILEESGSMRGTYSNAISQGSHTLVVKYTKDSNGSFGSDQASVSNITVGYVAGVGSEAFSGCSSLKTVTLGDSIGSLGDKAFNQCSNLQEIVIPDSVKWVGQLCFSGCTAMKGATIGDGVLNIAQYTFLNCTGLTNVMVGDGVTAINNYAFTGCSALTNVTLGRSVATINNYAFQNCSSLPEITLPQAVTKVGDYVFVGCSKLADVVIADRTTALALGSNGSSALFADCPLDSVYISGKITYSTSSSYGYSPFYRNASLRTVVITGREEQICDNEFYGCTNLQDVTIGNGVKSIGNYAFYGCTNLQDVTIGNGVKSIGNYAFSGCSSLEGFSFGSNMETIGAEAFSDCTSLTSITSHAAVPPACGAQALDDINKWSCTLRVPSGYAAAYQTADQWKEFFFVEDVVEVAKYKLTFMIDGEVYYTDSLVHKAEVTVPEVPEREGYTFSGWSEVPETMPAEDVTISGFFTINRYLVTFVIDGEVIASDSLEYGASIVAPVAPEKEGYTFNGWGEVAETVPAEDVTYYGSYSVNSYLLTYVVDGETVQSDSVAYGSTIVALEEPAKEGHTFSGWSEIPETMPAEDMTISGFFTVNIYKVYYYVGDELVHTAEVAYGEAIPEYVYEPTAEGDVFVGWVGEPYKTMPAHDVTYTANIESGIEEVENSKLGIESSVIYDLHGRKILVDDLRELDRGVYIIDNKKVVIK